MAAAVPRHGPRRLPGHPDDDAASTLVQAAPQDFLAHPGNWMQWISDCARHGHGRARTSRGCWRPGRSSGCTTSTCRRSRSPCPAPSPSTRTPSRRSSPPPRRSGSRPAACSRPSAWPRWRSAARSRRAVAGLVCDTVDRDRARARPRRQADRGRRPRRLRAGRPPPAAARPAGPGPGDARRRPRDATSDRPERHVGELLIRGHVGDARATTSGPTPRAELFHDGWLRTGDLAYLLDGELVLCGRIKDVIIVGGRNVFPEDIERAVGRIDGVRAGNVIAFGMEGYKGKESVVVVAEVRRPTAGIDLDALRHAIHHRTLEVCGLPPRDVMLVAAGDAAEDVVGQAAAGEVPGAVPRGAAGARSDGAHRPVFASDRHRAPRPRARDRVVGAAAAVRAPRPGRGDPRRAGRRRPVRDRRADRRPARRRSKPSTIRASCASCRRRGTSTSASRPDARRGARRVRDAGAAGGHGAGDASRRPSPPASAGGASRRPRR